MLYDSPQQNNTVPARELFPPSLHHTESPNSSPNLASDDVPHHSPLDLVRIPDICSAFTDFKHRLWLTWYISKAYPASSPEASVPANGWVWNRDCTRSVVLGGRGQRIHLPLGLHQPPLLKLFHEMPTMGWFNSC
jgi:hypothetical protein